MGLKVTKKKQTPAAMRKRKSQQRIRKKAVRKHQKQQPSWQQAMKKKYLGDKSKFLPKTTSDIKNEEDKGKEVQEEVNEEKQQRMNQRDPIETQLFLKNIPLLLTDNAELLALLQRYCPAVVLQHSSDKSDPTVTRRVQISNKLRRCFIVMNKFSNDRSTGSGFVHCGSVELMEALYHVAKHNAQELQSTARQELNKEAEGLSHHKAKKLKYNTKRNSIVVAAEATHKNQEPFLLIHEQRVTVHKAISRSVTIEASAQQALRNVSSTSNDPETAGKNKKKKPTKIAADDPRNLYLLQEGKIGSDSTAAKELPSQYVEMLERDYETRRQQLRNCNLFVSKTRLNVRNLPFECSDRDVRLLFSEHARAFLKANPQHMKKETWGKYGPIKNVKLLTNADGTSKGFGFVEFSNHDTALHVLRSLNNNPTVFGAKNRLVVSFAVENVVALQKLERIRENKKRRLESAPL